MIRLRMSSILSVCIGVLVLAGCKVDIEDFEYEKDNPPTETLTKKEAVQIVMATMGIHESWREDVEAMEYIGGFLMGDLVGPDADGLELESHTFYERADSQIGFVRSHGRSDRASGLSITAYRRTPARLCVYEPVDTSHRTMNGLNAIAGKYGNRFTRDGWGRPYVTGTVRISTARKFVEEAVSQSLLHHKCK